MSKIFYTLLIVYVFFKCVDVNVLGMNALGSMWESSVLLTIFMGLMLGYFNSLSLRICQAAFNVVMRK